MKGKEKMRNKKQQNNSIKAHHKQSKLFPRLITGLAVAGLIAGAGYGLLLVSSLFSITTELSNRKQAPETKQAVQAHQVPQPVDTPPVRQESVVEPEMVAVAKPAPVEPEEDSEIIAEDEMVDVEEDEVLDENGLIDQTEQAMAVEREIELLRNALPNNMMVPAEKTESEIAALMADAEEQHSLQERIDKGTASDEDRERYFDLIATQYEDEKELINYCSDLVSNPDGGENRPHVVCSQVAIDSKNRLKEIESSLEELRQRLL